MSGTTAYPLCWPAGWPRAAHRTRAQFGKAQRQFSTQPDGWYWNSKRQLTIADGSGRVIYELERLGVLHGEAIVSTNLRLRLDGLPASGQSEPHDPGAAVYWRIGDGHTKVMAIDRYDRVADNLAAIAATLEAMRAIERHGGGQILERAFTGFDALAAPLDPWQKLGVKRTATRDAIVFSFRTKAKDAHPDKPGGSVAAMQELNEAYRACLDAFDRENGKS